MFLILYIKYSNSCEKICRLVVWRKSWVERAPLCIFGKRLHNIGAIIEKIQIWKRFKNIIITFYINLSKVISLNKQTSKIPKFFVSNFKRIVLFIVKFEVNHFVNTFWIKFSQIVLFVKKWGILLKLIIFF